MDIKRIINVETVSHSIMFIASIASAFNIGEYLNESHNTITAYGLAFALGFGLMTLSTILSSISPNDKKPFWQMLSAVVLVALLSGTIQTLSYVKHNDVRVAALLGFGLPIVCELFIALALSAYDNYKRSLKIKNLEADIAEKINIEMSNAFNDIDVARIKQYVNAKVDEVVKNKVDVLMSTLLPPVTTQHEQHLSIVNSQHNQPVQPSQHVDTTYVDTEVNQHVEPEVEADVASTTIDDYVDQHPKRKSTGNAEKQQRQQQLLNMLSTVNGQQATVLNKKQLATQLNTTDTTINRDIKELTQHGLVNIDGIIEVYSTVLG